MGTSRKYSNRLPITICTYVQYVCIVCSIAIYVLRDIRTYVHTYSTYVLTHKYTLVHLRTLFLTSAFRGGSSRAITVPIDIFQCCLCASPKRNNVTTLARDERSDSFNIEYLSPCSTHDQQQQHRGMRIYVLHWEKMGVHEVE